MLNMLPVSALDNARIAQNLGQAEIEHLNLVARREHDVFRLDVAMNDAACVRFVQGVGNLCRNRERLAQIWQLALEPRSQSFPFNVLKDYEAVVALLPDLVDSAYIRVIESGCGLGLSQQTLSGTLIGSDFCWEGT